MSLRTVAPTLGSSWYLPQAMPSVSVQNTIDRNARWRASRAASASCDCAVACTRLASRRTFAWPCFAASSNRASSAGLCFAPRVTSRACASESVPDRNDASVAGSSSTARATATVWIAVFRSEPDTRANHSAGVFAPVFVYTPVASTRVIPSIFPAHATRSSSAQSVTTCAAWFPSIHATSRSGDPRLQRVTQRFEFRQHPSSLQHEGATLSPRTQHLFAQYRCNVSRVHECRNVTTPTGPVSVATFLGASQECRNITTPATAVCVGQRFVRSRVPKRHDAAASWCALP